MKARRLSGRRGAAMVLVVGLGFILSGDRARSAIPPGIDPLEVLNLQVKPNVIIVLDSSGSMTETVVANPPDTLTGDHPRSKMGQAKQVLNQVIADNEQQASFLFGQYTSDATQSGTGKGGDRWFYGTDSNASPSMLTQEIVLEYYAFQQIAATNNTFYFGEAVGATGTMAICQFNVPVGSYAPGAGAGTMAQALTNGMNAPTSCTPARGATPNVYTVTWNAGNRRFDYRDTGGGTHTWMIRWGNTPTPTIRGVLTCSNASNPCTGGIVTANSAIQANGATYNAGSTTRLSRRDNSATFKFNDTVTIDDGPPPVTATYTFYTMRSTRFWNGQTLHVLPPPSQTVCAVTSGAGGDGSAANPWFLDIAVRATCGAASGTPVRFTYIGSSFGGNGVSCAGFQQNVPLIPCDQTTPTQVSTISPFLRRQIAETVPNSAATCAGGGCGIAGYSESTEGLFNQVTAGTPGGIPANGSTPVIQTILDIKGTNLNLTDEEGFNGCPNGGPDCPRGQRNFHELWENGQAASPGPPPVAALTAIKDHTPLKEKTILIFVTDGDPTCADPNGGGGSVSDNLALGAAFAAEQAFTRIDPAFSESSLPTYFVAFGGGASATRADWIAWGGSGFTSTMVASVNGGTGTILESSGTANPTPPAGVNEYIRWAIGPTAQNKMDLCPTCIDAFIAPDANKLAEQLQAIINQGASDGEFSAQQSVTSNVYEYTNQIAGTDVITDAPFDPANPSTRLAGFVPTRFVSTFTLPSFQGQVRAFTDINGDGTAEQQWSAGDELVSLVSTGRNGSSGMSACIQSGTPGECTFLELHADATDANIGSSAAAIQRRIYSTSRNDNFGLTAQDVLDRASPGRVAIWPPVPDNVAPASDTAVGVLDAALGLPTGTPTATDFTDLQTTYRACRGNGVGGLPVDGPASGHPCSSANTAAVRGAKARREAREMLLAFAAGAEFSPDAGANPKRLTTGTSEILFIPRGWILAEGTLSTPAVVAPPVAPNTSEEPAPGRFDDEYRVFRDGLRETGNVSAGDGTSFGFGLRNPDKDSLAPIGPNPNTSGPPTIPIPDTRQDLKPVMTVLYVGTNLMLHAFRGGPCTNSATCTETGGEELWAFVPFDQVGKITARYLNDPQPRDPHDYVIATSLRFGDIFVQHPAAGAALIADVGGVDYNSACAGARCDGVWRRVLYVGRGIAGKYWTALDVTNPEKYTRDSVTANPPLVYWSRGNPDTQDGTPAGTAVGTATDTAGYATMGETWSVPAVNFVDNGTSGVNFVLNMGSGFSTDIDEGHNFYTVDALTGSMIASADVDAAAAAIGGPFARSGAPFPTAIVANPAGFTKSRFLPNVALHPARDFTTRNFVGDVQGRVWKFLVSNPSVALPVADIGADQPIGTPLALFGLLGNPGSLTAVVNASALPGVRPAIFGSSGNDNRVPAAALDPIPQFKHFAFLDIGDDTDVTVDPPEPVPGPVAIDIFPPNIQFILAREFDAASNFRGTLQPTTAALDRLPPTGQADGAVVFFGGTRFNPAGTALAPPGPSNGGEAPCRSSFDSIVFALDINTGGAAFDTVTGADGYTIFQDSRLVGLFTTYSPDTAAGGKLVLDEGLVNGPVQPPPPAGQPLGGTSDYSVTSTLRPQYPAPGVRFGSTVCN